MRNQKQQNMIQDLPIGIQDFRSIRDGNFLYVDKTKALYPLVEKSKGVYFLSRPRRFGKSLLVSTLQCLFEGEKELFEARGSHCKGLWIENNWDFEENTHPVIKFDMSVVSTLNVKDLQHDLKRIIHNNANRLGLKLTEKTIAGQFEQLIAYTVKKHSKDVVILIDEYDKPILDHLFKKDLDQIREVMRSFYGILKDQGKNTRFLFITGISKFSKMSIFSALNNLQDISLNKKYGQLLGIAEEEIGDNFGEYIKQVTQRQDVTEEELMKQITYWYDGYSFDGEHFVYNPFSLLNFFNEGEFRNYWIESGSPQFLMNYIRRYKLKGVDLQGKPIREDLFSRYEIEDTPPESFFYQSGYLTLSKKTDLGFVLDYPNMEVKSSFNSLVLEGTYKLEPVAKDNDVMNVYRGFKEDNIELVINSLNHLFSGIPYDLVGSRESYYHSIMLVTFWAAGMEARAEEHTSKGRSDIVIDFKNKVWIIELKRDKSTQQAIEQIKDKGYYQKYVGKRKKVFLIGIKVDMVNRRLEEYKVEEIV